MNGKITLEEHFALPETFTSTARFSKKGMGEDLRRRLTDLQDERLKEMDQFDIEFAIQSLNSPAVLAVQNVKAAKELAKPKDLVCITGSIFTVAEAKKCFQHEKSLTNLGSTPHPRK